MADPSFGGITASYGSTADIIISEPGALIGFAGPRVIREATGKDLPKGFQTAEFLLEKGFVDVISHRKDLKQTLADTVNMLMNRNK
jgi:acetyl-CoA carboxylase carboxyl transferase subunit beta